MTPIKILDTEGGCIELKEVYGFGAPALLVGIEQESDWCGINLSVVDAESLARWLNAFVAEKSQ